MYELVGHYKDALKNEKKRIHSKEIEDIKKDQMECYKLKNTKRKLIIWVQ